MSEATEFTLHEKLCWPFRVKQVKWRIGASNQKKMAPNPATRGLPLAYIDARDVMERLDHVAGFENWQTKMLPGHDGLLICQLSIKIGGEWITKSDVAGETGTQGGMDKSDSQKGSGSDALKRSAVQFGIFRYGYSLDSEWVELDEKGNFTPPELPEWATPKGFKKLLMSKRDCGNRELNQQEYNDLALSVTDYRKQKGAQVVNSVLENMGKSDTSKWTVKEWGQFIDEVGPLSEARS